MKQCIFTLIFLIFNLKSKSQNFKTDVINALYYYKTVDDFFNNKIDSIVGTNIKYNYGKVSFFDSKSNKKIKFSLRGDSMIFAFRLYNKTNQIYAIAKGEKRYGSYMGGSKKLFAVFYSNGNLYFTKYDKKNYLISYSGEVDKFGYYIVFNKINNQPKKNYDIEYFIDDNQQLYNRYLKEREESTTFNWTKNYILKQIEYLKIYNND